MKTQTHKIVALAVLSLSIGACAGAQSRARTALDITAYGVRVGYQVTSEAYTLKSAEAVRQVAQNGGTYEDYVRLMQPLTVALSALDVAADVLQRGAVLLDLWSDDVAFRDQWRAWARECTTSLQIVADDLRAAGVPVPDAVIQALQAAGALL